MARVDSFPMCIDWLPDGRLLIVSSAAQLLLAQESDGSLVTYADLSGLTDFKWNDIATDGRGHSYVNETGFDFPGGEFAPGRVALVGPDRTARLVAEGVAFPNGMAVSPDGAILIVAESYGSRLTAFDIRADGSLSPGRLWADLAGGVPDGICVDAEGSVWYADVPHQSCVRVREGGEVQQTVELDRGGFACALGGADGRTLFVTTNECAVWRLAAAVLGTARWSRSGWRYPAARQAGDRLPALGSGVRLVGRRRRELSSAMRRRAAGRLAAREGRRLVARTRSRLAVRGSAALRRRVQRRRAVAREPGGHAGRCYQGLVLVAAGAQGVIEEGVARRDHRRRCSGSGGSGGARPMSCGCGWRDPGCCRSSSRGGRRARSRRLHAKDVRGQ